MKYPDIASYLQEIRGGGGDGDISLLRGIGQNFLQMNRTMNGIRMSRTEHKPPSRSIIMFKSSRKLGRTDFK